jgi:sugar lactone lactonase YvrE
VDRDRGYLYIADPAGQSSALIVVNLQTGHARRVLQGHFSLCPKPIDLVIDGQPVQIETDQGKRVRPHVGVNPIALDPDGRWLYFGPMHGRRMYRLPTAALRDGSLEEWQLAQLIEDWAAKPISDGSSADTAGNVYISDVGNHAIGVSTVSGYHVIAQDERLLKWPDAFSFGPDGMLYVATNQLHLGPVLNAGQDASEPPYFILRLRPLAPGRVGR